jgi:signal transduction histidine kinase
MITMVERDGRRIAALVHDPAVLEDESLVRAVAAAAGLQLENERLQAELRSQLEEVRASRARIVEATQDERRRIERNLHDGTQQRLVAIAMTLGLAEAKVATDAGAARRLITEARDDLSSALEELRMLSQGIHPGILTERGLGNAVDELALRTRLPVEVEVSLSERLPTQVETAAYYVIAEALTNVVKHARASRARVRVRREDGRALIAISDDGRGGADTRGGSGLRGLRDRVEALGGLFALESPVGAGTRIEVEIPCG